jgi:hypothetical protein
MIAASKGDLSFLSYIIGIYCALFTIKNIVFSILSPSWKGSLNYTQLALWVEKSNGLRYKSEHILAAVGMGLKIGGEL